eukprot:2991873-Pyramimonas_sp.AAC.1
MLEYSRDSLAEPLRQLELVYSAITKKRFLPDSTRSGRWVDPSARASFVASTAPPEGARRKRQAGKRVLRDQIRAATGGPLGSAGSSA